MPLQIYLPEWKDLPPAPLLNVEIEGENGMYNNYTTIYVEPYDKRHFVFFFHSSVFKMVFAHRKQYTRNYCNSWDLLVYDRNYCRSLDGGVMD